MLSVTSKQIKATFTYKEDAINYVNSQINSNLILIFRNMAKSYNLKQVKYFIHKKYFQIESL